MLPTSPGRLLNPLLGGGGALQAYSLGFDFFNNPSLTGNRGGTISLTRATTATYVGSNGLIQTASANTPRFDYDPVTLLCKGFLVEAAATNLILQSRTLSTTWTAGNVTIGGSTTLLDGATGTVNKIQETNAVTVVHSILQSVTVAANTTYTLSVDLLAAERTKCRLDFLDIGTGTNGFIVNIDLTAVTASGSISGVGVFTSATITASGGGWYRVTATGKIDTGATTAAFTRVIVRDAAGSTSYTGTTGSGLFADFYGIEAGAVATSRIPTTTVAVTRNADVATIATGSWYNALAGTLYAEWNNPSVSGAYRVASFNDGTTNNLIDLFVSSITVAGAQTVLSGGLQTNLFAATVTGGAVAKSVNVFKGSDFAGFANNATLGTSSSGTVPTVTRLEIGSSAGANQLNSTIRAIRYYPYRMQNNQAQALTV